MARPESRQPRSRGASDERLRSRCLVGWRGLTLAALLTMPILAMSVLARTLDGRLVFGSAAAASLLAFVLYWHDKRRARAGEWRVPEFTLHVVEFLGGWPGAFVAQELLRHKTVKVRFQFVFWCIVLVHQYAAFEFLRGWPWSRIVWPWLMQRLGSGK